MTPLLQPAIGIPAAALAAAGGLLFLALVNRRLLVIRDGRYKLLLLMLAFGLLAAGGAALALVLPPTGRIGVPLAVFGAVAWGEWRRIRIRRACRGSPPVGTVLHDVPLFRPVTTTDLVCHRFELVLPEWRGPAFRIAHLTDFHVHPGFDEGYYRAALERAAALKPDLAFFTGDYVSRAVAIPILERILRPIGRLGDYAVLGNHDHWTDPARIAAVLERAGLQVLAGACAELDLGGSRLRLVGCDYGGYQAIRIPPFPRQPGMNLVLCHTPDAIYTLARAGARVVFSGHNHAGQARLPGIGPIIVPSRFGRRFDHGHFEVEGTHLFVSSGVGAGTPPFRFFCQPDLFVVDLSGPPAPAGGA